MKYDDKKMSNITGMISKSSNINLIGIHDWNLKILMRINGIKKKILNHLSLQYMKKE